MTTLAHSHLLLDLDLRAQVFTCWPCLVESIFGDASQTCNFIREVMKA